jgi:hypothetical protein
VHGTQGGVHVKERGNEALPADVVKVLKTQDENYVRTMRSAGVKVRPLSWALSFPVFTRAVAENRPAQRGAQRARGSHWAQL